MKKDKKICLKIVNNEKYCNFTKFLNHNKC